MKIERRLPEIEPPPRFESKNLQLCRMHRAMFSRSFREKTSDLWENFAEIFLACSCNKRSGTISTPVCYQTVNSRAYVMVSRVTPAIHRKSSVHNRLYNKLNERLMINQWCNDHLNVPFNRKVKYLDTVIYQVWKFGSFEVQGRDWKWNDSRLTSLQLCTKYCNQSLDRIFKIYSFLKKNFNHISSRFDDITLLDKNKIIKIFNLSLVIIFRISLFLFSM